MYKLKNANYNNLWLQIRNRFGVNEETDKIFLEYSIDHKAWIACGNDNAELISGTTDTIDLKEFDSFIKQ